SASTRWTRCASGPIRRSSRSTSTASGMRPRVRELREEDWPAVAAVYLQGIHSGLATFETDVPAWEDWDAAHLPEPRLVAELDGAVAGWAALAPTSSRHVYRGVAEDSVYVAGAAQGRGVGRALLTELVARARADGMWTIQAGVFPENAASLALHE